MGIDAARDHLRDRRRDPGRPAVQGRADGRAVGRLHPRELLDMPVDYDSLEVGSIMGSGGMIVMDETSCMVDVARFFMEFCGRSRAASASVPGRHDPAMHDLLTRSSAGGPAPATWSSWRAVRLVRTSLCGLGRAPRTRSSARCATSATSTSRTSTDRVLPRPGSCAIEAEPAR